MANLNIELKDVEQAMNETSFYIKNFKNYLNSCTNSVIDLKASWEGLDSEVFTDSWYNFIGKNSNCEEYINKLDKYEKYLKEVLMALLRAQSKSREYFSI